MSVVALKQPGSSPASYSRSPRSICFSDPAENWDEDFEFNAGTHAQDIQMHDDNARKDAPAPARVAPAPPTTPLREKKNTLPNWAEPGPSTPLRRLQQTENWDDDFQDDSPNPAAHRAGKAPQNGAVHPSGSGSPVENWDDEFEDNPRNGTSPRRRTPRKKTSWGSSDEEDEDGFGDREDDRTVTSRSRGMPFAISCDIPPVPPLPSPFPRSPTASVFSVPVSSTGRESSAGHSYMSTAHLALRPTVSGSSAVAARLALLPPSPPIHRERRRLRKKSRPPHHFEEGIFELDDRAELAAEQARPVTPENTGKKPPAAPAEDPQPEVGNTSTTTKTPLLSRIGSVGKKWSTGRKKRASHGPTEIALKERDEQPPPRQREHDDSGGSRPTSFFGGSSPGHGTGGSKNWFFRGGGGGQGPGSGGASPAGDSPLKHEKSVERLLHLMGVDRDRGREPGSPSSMDRKGKGRAHGREGTGSSALPEDLEAAVDGSAVPNSALFGGGTPRRPTSMQVASSNGSNSSAASSWNNRPPVPRHVSYTDGRHRRPTTPSSRASSKPRSASASVEDVHRAKKSSTAASGRASSNERSSDAHGHAVPGVPPLEGDEKGSRRFMGGIRRISLGGSKHKRTKSITPEEKKLKTVSAALVAQDAHESQDQSTPRPPSRTIRSSIDVPLLPPIELQPPSPPRNRGKGDRKSFGFSCVSALLTLTFSRTSPSVSDPHVTACASVGVGIPRDGVTNHPVSASVSDSRSTVHLSSSNSLSRPDGATTKST